MAKRVYLSPSDQRRNTYAVGSTTEDVQCGRIAEACRIALERSAVTALLGALLGISTAQYKKSCGAGV